MIKAILFDMDGTLVNTEELKRKAHERTLRSQGILKLLDLADYAAVMGRPYNEAAETLMKGAGINLPMRDYRHFWEGFYRNLVDEFAAAHDGVPKLFQLIRQRRIEIAIVSSSTHMEMERVLRKTGLSEWAKNIVSADDMEPEKQKPEPDPYLKALKLTHVTGKEALVVEDTDAGCESACAAGVPVIAVQHELNTKHRFKGTRRRLPVSGMANPERFLNSLLEP
jgi:HAD superfamily hydrolase (TIGR01509 family)